MLTRFQLKENNTTVSTEFFGGLTSFLASFYIIIVNPAILSQAGLPFDAVCTATVMAAAFTTILMGLYANNPIILAPGMGLNAYFTYSVVIGKQIPPEVALGIVFWSGTLAVLLSVLTIREKLIAFIPKQIRYAVSCGIGIFISFIGLQKGGIIVHHTATIVTMGEFTPQVLTFFAALLISIALVVKNVRASLVLGIVVTFLLTIPLGRIYGAEQIIKFGDIIAFPNFELFGKVDIMGALKLSFIPTILGFMFTDLFDTISTLVGVCEAGNLLDKDGMPRNMKKTLLADSIATPIAAILGTSSTTSYIESAAGIQQGARTGLSSVFAGLMFLPFIFLSPLLSMFSPFTTAPALVIVGVFMMGPITKIEWDKLQFAVPAFLAMVLIPLSFSITTGIVVGLVVWYFLRLFQIGRTHI
jgi:AGZA family xanthine/uracil permease-like MFS transporter